LVAYGIRSCFLADFVSLKEEDLYRFEQLQFWLQQIKKKLQFSVTLCFLVISSEFLFVVNIELLQCRIRRFLIENVTSCVFIDADASLENPQCSCSSLEASIRNELSHALVELQNLLETFRSSELVEVNLVHLLKTPQLMPTLTGWLLEYPFVYCICSKQLSLSFNPGSDSISSEELRLAGNSLSMVPLNVYRLFFQGDLSYLDCILDAKHESDKEYQRVLPSNYRSRRNSGNSKYIHHRRHDRVLRSKTMNKVSEDYMAFSFSVPSVLNIALEKDPAIENFLCNLQTILVNQPLPTLWKGPRVTIEQVTLPFVVL